MTRMNTPTPSESCGPRCGATATPESVIGGGAVRSDAAHGFVLHFPSLFDHGRGYAFPCNERGEVDWQALTPRGRANYLSACRTIGRDFGVPAVLSPARH